MLILIKNCSLFSQLEEYHEGEMMMPMGKKIGLRILCLHGSYRMPVSKPMESLPPHS